MDMRWNLDVLYTSFEAPELKQDWEKLSAAIEELQKWAKQNLQSQADAVEKMEAYITKLTSILQTQSRLYGFAELTASVDAKNEKALQLVERIQDQAVELVEPGVLFQKWLGGLEQLDMLIAKSPLLETHRYFLTETAEKSKYLLSEKEEIILAKMKNTGSNAWAKLQEMLTSTLLVEITVDGEQKQLPLPVVRNMAFEKDPELRKKAYEAELAAYKKLRNHPLPA